MGVCPRDGTAGFQPNHGHMEELPSLPGVGGGFLRSMQGKTAGRQLMIQNDRDGYPDVAGMCTNCDLKYRGKSGHCNECEHLSQDERSSCLCLYRKSQAKMNCWHHPFTEDETYQALGNSKAQRIVWQKFAVPHFPICVGRKLVFRRFQIPVPLSMNKSFHFDGQSSHSPHMVFRISREPRHVPGPKWSREKRLHLDPPFKRSTAIRSAVSWQIAMNCFHSGSVVFTHRIAVLIGKMMMNHDFQIFHMRGTHFCSYVSIYIFIWKYSPHTHNVSTPSGWVRQPPWNRMK